ncbi:hypothetical protein Dsin_002868 [Dipteronia sinensis]|uniref:Uncharacterized protein n=1 Tax=Dipteronia sinensis TaxID=43782 RepID=A0AAE0B6X4_9ROSI|nr:hypothetical protein Dsin_002868 [Dipteronia sinensis]
MESVGMGLGGRFGSVLQGLLVQFAGDVKHKVVGSRQFSTQLTYVSDHCRGVDDHEPCDQSEFRYYDHD